jgi:hypothetical protein
MNYFKRFLIEQYNRFKWIIEVRKFDKYRKKYDSFTFTDKVKITNKWALKYPEQAHFNYEPIKYWLDNVVTKPASILEIGGWRGDLAAKVLASFDQIIVWHNFDLLKADSDQKCYDDRYKLISMNDDIWHLSLNHEYNALIATHMIEHIKWREFTEVIKWIPESVRTVLFEAPIQASGENINWMGDHSTHVLEKGWEQIVIEMKNQGFSVYHTEESTYIFNR